MSYSSLLLALGESIFESLHDIYVNEYVVGSGIGFSGVLVVEEGDSVGLLAGTTLNSRNVFLWPPGGDETIPGYPQINRTRIIPLMLNMKVMIVRVGR